MELLITGAIIGVMVALSIPGVASQPENCREATDLSNVRAAYAKLLTTEEKYSNYKDTLPK